MNLVFDSLDMPASQAFDFAAELKISANGPIIQQPEAVDDGRRTPDHLDDIIGV
jgi:hypothetical protein